MTPEERLERYARLAVEVGANVGEGQVVWVIALPEHAPLARQVARVAYENGASYVDVDYADQHVRRARIQLASTLRKLSTADSIGKPGSPGSPPPGKRSLSNIRRPLNGASDA